VPAELLCEPTRTDEAKLVSDVDDTSGPPTTAHGATGYVHLAGQKIWVYPGFLKEKLLLLGRLEG